MDTQISMMDIKAWKRKRQREGRAMIEKNLHPNPVINGVAICHRHCGQYVIFTAWQTKSTHHDEPANKKMLKYRREFPMTEPDFYKVHANDMNWLCQPD